MTCNECRDALSAQLDDEEHGAASADVDAHLARCAACRQWYDDAATITRAARTARADDAIDVASAVLPAAPRPARVPVGLVLRVALAIVAMAQLLIGVLQLASVELAVDHIHVGAVAGHTGDESAAWGIAIGAGFLWIAARRGRPTGALPILTVFVAALVVLNVNDLIAGDTDFAHVATHSFVAVGYVIVLALLHPAATAHRPSPDRTRGASDRAKRAEGPGTTIRQLPRSRPTFERPAGEARRAA